MNHDVIILLAEDNSGHAKLIKKHLKRAGLNNTIIHFENGSELIQYLMANRAEKCHPEEGQKYFAIMDLKMPVMDGQKTLEYLKKEPKLSAMPVIILSTSDDPKEINQCYLLGCNGYIVKPVISEDFTEFIQNLASYFKIIQIPVIK
ncbi:MAG: response regulator [Candidatus Marinimicrobia bacterium]|nr:response regulator [Candidatus Neomarinimicrobiota bacterium]